MNTKLNAVLIFSIFALLLQSGCGRSSRTGGEKPAQTKTEMAVDSTAAEPNPESQPNPPTISVTELQLTLLEKFGLTWCDPDVYPIASMLSPEEIAQSLSEYQKDAAAYKSILRHLGFAGRAELNETEQKQVYSLYRRARAIVLVPEGNRYRFDFFASKGNLNPNTKEEGNYQVSGTIGPDREIRVENRVYGRPNCPRCLSASTRIATPDGEIPVTDLREGMIVWTQALNGQRIAQALLACGKLPVPPSHPMLHLQLADGREIQLSPGHPGINGSPLAKLECGDILDGSAILSRAIEKYEGEFTYDLLPAGGTGFYWANGILIASTLNRSVIGLSD